MGRFFDRPSQVVELSAVDCTVMAKPFTGTDVANSAVTLVKALTNISREFCCERTDAR